MNTSIINIGTFGLPVFYAAIVLCLFSVGTGIIKVRSGLMRNALIMFIIIFMILLFIVTAQLLLGIGDDLAAIKQLVSRVMLALYMLMSTIVLGSVSDVNKIVRTIILLLKVVISYGYYQLIAQFLKYPLFLEFLRNSASFLLDPEHKKDNQVAGWLFNIRIESIFAEPSFSALPIAIFLYLLIYYKKTKTEGYVWGLIALVYGVLTFSRVLWIAVLGLLFCESVIKIINAINKEKAKIIIRKAAYIVIPLFVIASIQWIYLAPKIMTDWSSLGRSSSIIIGLRIFADNILLGTGFNSYITKQYEYNYGFPMLDEELLVHNLFVGYAQQMGILGLLYSLLPILFILFCRQVDLYKRLSVAIVFILIGQFGGDIFYMSFSWLIIALFAIENSNNTNTEIRLECEYTN